MKYIKPKIAKKKVTWNISEKTMTILTYYSKYSKYKEEEVVDMFLENLLTDHGFVYWINKQRNKKKIEAILRDCELVNGLEGLNQNAET
ncbi:hypothetical protein [Clostridium grantii]|uniref:Uncharacterized protein n=1 Tax=Clostridium grantii DSM 8605 TaxID=1121316 RepID=A0A1M5RQH4_9CLOT|nr:hypothetical protein [Clostridium grantii]SHH28456.1 hypothetical protein SAMN02745207_00658 [Clostridium grantii DSM 8605]